MSKLKEIVEGWKNNLTPTQFLDQQVIDVSAIRLGICATCDEYSMNKKDYKSMRPDVHCTNCGCTLAAKTKCLSCECPLNKWNAVTPITNE